jgi:hypothetical protein
MERMVVVPDERIVDVVLWRALLPGYNATATRQRHLPADPAAKSITYTGQMDDIVKPGAKVNVRQVIRLMSHDSHVMEWYETRDGKEAKIMEIVYSRAK